MAIAPSRSLNQEVDHAAAILAADPQAAQRAAQRVLATRPGDPRALLILASARRRQGDAKSALAILVSLAQAHPRAAHTRYELGRALAANRQPGEAIAAYRQAVALKPDLAEAWRALGETLFSEGDNRGAEAAFNSHDRAMVGDPSLQAAADALYTGRPAEAETLLTGLLTTRPDHAPTLRLLAEALGRLDRHRAAEIVLERALKLDPDHQGARFSYANALFQQQKAVEALDVLQSLLLQHPREPAYLNLIAACHSLVGDFDLVIAINEALLTEYPKQPKIWLNYGHALRTVGRRSDAVTAYRKAIEIAPANGEAYWSLANLKVEALSTDDEAAIEALLGQKALGDDEKINLQYALGKSFEDRGRHASAFAHYADGAKIRRRARDYDADAMSAQIARIKSVFNDAFFSRRQGWGFSAPDPIFIVGLPRSGSTLVEQILASHSKVEGTMELSNIDVIATDLGWTGVDYPLPAADLDMDGAEALGALYLRSTRPYRKLPRPRFVDKMPHNFQHLGLIHLILPNARIIDVRRHPLGAGFSVFKQNFSRGQFFSNDLTDLGRYYHDYVGLMSHFDHVLPSKIHRIIYEDLVENTEVEIRRLLDYCGLPFEETCLQFHDTVRAVRTVSSEQVRRPIFREGLNQWIHYEPYLGPLKDGLGDTLAIWR